MSHAYRRGPVCAMAAALFLSATAFVPAALAAPKLGDKALPIKVDKWIQNKRPPVLPGETGSKNVFIVEFWATWCGPCKQSIPHLAKLHEAYHEKGLTIISLSNEEPETVAGFAAKQNMPYYVGVFDFDSATSKWMDGVNGIPHSYVVDRKGFIVWAGHPNDLDQIVPAVMADKFDMAAEKRRTESAERSIRLLREVQMAYQSGQPERALKLLDEMIKNDPANTQAHLIRRHVLRSLHKSAEVLQAATASLEKAAANSPEALLNIAQVELTYPVLGERDPGLALRCAKRAVVVSGGRDYTALSALARTQAELGMIDAAIATQRSAIAQADGKAAEDARRTLAYFESVSALAAASHEK